jgi:hypothetical protein
MPDSTFVLKWIRPGSARPPRNATKSTPTPMPEGSVISTKRVLEACERISEVLFGLIMVLTFTGSLSVAVALLFVCGFAFGRVVGYRPIPTGLVMVFLGVIIVAFTIALGG